MNIDGTITPEQLDELDAIRNEIFYLHLHTLTAPVSLQRYVAHTYNRAALLYAAITHRAVVLIDSGCDGVVQPEQTEWTGTYCRECLADADTAHYPHCTFRQ